MALSVVNLYRDVLPQTNCGDCGYPACMAFAGRVGELKKRAETIGGTDQSGDYDSADLAMKFQVLSRVPVMLVFWDAEPEDGFGTDIKLLFDETITRHLDIESIMFLSERLKDLLLEK